MDGNVDQLIVKRPTTDVRQELRTPCSYVVIRREVQLAAVDEVIDLHTSFWCHNDGRVCPKIKDSRHQLIADSGEVGRAFRMMSAT